MNRFDGRIRLGREDAEMSENSGGAGVVRARVVKPEEDHSDAADALLHSKTRTASKENSCALKTEFDAGEKANRNVSRLVRNLKADEKS